MDKEQLRKHINRFIEHKQRKWNPKARVNNLYYFSLLQNYLSDNSLFNRETIVPFFNSLENRGLAESTRHQAETAIFSLVKWLFREHTIKKDWTENIERTKVNLKPKILPSQSDVLELINQATKPGKYDNVLTTFSKMEHRDCLRFMVVACGGRNFETSQILRKDVSISGNQLQLVHGKNGPRNQAIPNVPWLIEMLKRRVEGRRTPEALHVLRNRSHFKERDLERLFVVNGSKLEETMRKVSKICGQRIKVHDLRAIFAQDLKKNGASIDDIKDVMGHKSINTTMGYLQYDTSSQAKTLLNFSTETRKYRTKEEKAKELISHAWDLGRVIEGGDLNGNILTLKIEIT